MTDREVIKNKIRDILVYLKEIEPDLKLSAKEILGDYHKLRTMERNFQLIVDAIVDINTHIITRGNLPSPDDYQSTFAILAEGKILPVAFALKIKPVVGLRNQIVHQYGKIDRVKFISDLKKGIKDFKDYIRFIKKYLERVD